MARRVVQPLLKGRLVKLLVPVLVVLLAPALVHADANIGVHVGGGIDGGVMSKVVRPDPVAQAGLSLEWLLPGHDWGVGVNVEAVGRFAPRFDVQEEATYDLQWRFASHDRNARAGLGVGLRSMLFARDVGRPEETVLGVDFIRFDGSLRFVDWNVGQLGATAGIDGYIAWTFGCYSGTRHEAAVGDMPSVGRDIRCGDTITTTYVVGVQTSMQWR